MANKTTYARLDGGGWGLRVEGPISTGQSVCVTKKSGESKTETVGKVLWTDGKFSLCTIAAGSSNGQRYRNTPPPSRSRRGKCRSPGCCNPADQDCSYGRARDGYCGSCAYDEF